MTISVRGASGLVAGTNTSATFGAPAGVTVDDLFFLFFGCKPYTASITSGPFISTATPVINTTSGTTGNGNGTGSTRLQVAHHTVVGGEGSFSSTMTGTPSPRITAELALYKSNPGAWGVEAQTANDTSATGTGISCTAAASMDIVAGDLLVFVVVGMDDMALNSSAFSVTGCTLGSWTEHLSTNTTITGFDGFMNVYTVPVTAGTASGAPNFTGTVTSGKSEVSASFLRIREPANTVVDFWGARV